MIEYKKTIKDFDDLKKLCWSGASDRLNTIEGLGVEDEFMQYLEEMLGYETLDSETEINDFIWFECDNWIEQHKCEEDDENDDDWGD